MPKPTSPKHQSKDSLQSVTKKEMEKLFAGQREEMEQLLADQANVILESVDELVEKKMDKKLDEKFDPVITKLDAVLKEFEDHRDERRPTAEARGTHREARDRTGIILPRLCSSTNATTAKRRSGKGTTRWSLDLAGLTTHFASDVENRSSRS